MQRFIYPMSMIGTSTDKRSHKQLRVLLPFALTILESMTLVSQAHATATVKYCKGTNLSGDCRTVNVEDDGKCSQWP